jgi:hypothetical protein
MERSGLAGKMPRLVACGGRRSAFEDFQIAHHSKNSNDFVAMLIDSEEPIADVEKTWEHLANRDQWAKPKGAKDEQVLLMTTCMETWIVADRAALIEHYGNKLQISALPALMQLENRSRQTIQNQLIHATRKCSNAYGKGKRSFELLAILKPEILQGHLPSFVRVCRILEENL